MSSPFLSTNLFLGNVQSELTSSVVIGINYFRWVRNPVWRRLLRKSTRLETFQFPTTLGCIVPRAESVSRFYYIFAKDQPPPPRFESRRTSVAHRPYGRPTNKETLKETEARVRPMPKKPCDARETRLD